MINVLNLNHKLNLLVNRCFWKCYYETHTHTQLCSISIEHALMFNYCNRSLFHLWSYASFYCCSFKLWLYHHVALFIKLTLYDKSSAAPLSVAFNWYFNDHFTLTHTTLKWIHWLYLKLITNQLLYNVSYYSSFISLRNYIWCDRKPRTNIQKLNRIQ